MHCVGFELTTPDSERAKAIHVLDRSATVTGNLDISFIKLGTVSYSSLYFSYMN
jgi:hypothetical protein